jgi:hypothetical protein
MCSKMSWDVCKTPTHEISTHPAGDARMRCCLIALEQIGFNEEASEIRKKWDEFLRIVGQSRTDDYYIAYPETILKSAAEFCLVGIKEIGCEITHPATSDKVSRLLNDSWKQFWQDPQKFSEWEQTTISTFKETL